MATVLIVDDELPIVDLLGEVVTTAGHQAIGCTNGEEALALVQKHKPALIITDLHMPGTNGFDLIEAVHADPLLASTTILLMSAGTRPAFLPAKTAFLLKPLNLRLVDSFLRHLP